jgi:hypothetical protein
MSLPIDLALEDCSKQLVPNFSGTAKKYGVDRMTLTRRFRGTQTSYREARSENLQCLTLAQEEVLISFINKLTDRSMPPTSQIVKNCAEELAGQPVGKNWVSDFVKRYKDVLHSAYLRAIDRQRVKAEHPALIKQFFDQVSVLY